MVRLERGLSNLADVIERDLGIDVRSLRGGGAAGGLAAGAGAFFGAELRSGVDAVADEVGLDEALRGSAWVVTGEGRFDEPSLRGKVVSGVAKRAKSQAVPVAVIAGRVDVEPGEAARHGIVAMESCITGRLGEAESMARASESLQSAARRFARRYLAEGPEA